MNAKYLVCLLIIVCALSTFAQNAQKKPVLNENTIVMDADGMQYPYAIWQKLMQSGDYAIKSKSDPSQSEPTFLIYKLTEEEKALRKNRMPKPRESTNFTTGEKLANFSASDIDGTKYKTKEMAGKVIVLNFWFINCPPCRREIPDLNKLVAKYKNNPDVVFLAIALDDAYALKSFLKSTPYNYNIVDNGRYIAQQYKITSYPTHVVTDRNGKVLFHTTGLASNTVDWVEKSIEAGLASVTEPQPAKK